VKFANGVVGNSPKMIPVSVTQNMSVANGRGEFNNAKITFSCFIAISNSDEPDTASSRHNQVSQRHTKQ